jgi:hypothetical protein
MDLDPDSDIYGRHAATPERPLGLPARFLGHDLMIPWSAFTYPGAAPVASHAVGLGHPAGMYFERAGVVHHEPFSSIRDGMTPWSRVGTLVRFGEKPIKKLTSRD